MKVLAQRHDREEVRALPGHTRLETAQVHTTIRLPQLKQAVAFFEASAQRMVPEEPWNAKRILGTLEYS